MAEYCGAPQAKASNDKEYRVCLCKRAIIGGAGHVVQDFIYSHFFSCVFLRHVMLNLPEGH
jgi:hypothetical protein